MRAWQITQPKTPPELTTLPPPQPARGQALIRVRAAALNFADLLMIEGSYQDTPPLPFVPGLELSGEVMALGPDTPGPTPGTRVAAYVGAGALAEQALVPLSRLIPLPRGLPLDAAAALPIAYGTSHLALAHRARLQPGETLLVLGAAGGVGLTAVEIGARLGARVIACARGADRLAIARAAGASETLDSETPDLKAALKALGPLDVVYDPVGGPAFDAALRACRPEARLLTIGFASGSVPQIAANLLLVKNLTVMGLYWGAYANFAPQVLNDSLATLFDWAAKGLIRPHISHHLPFDRLPEGLDLLRRRAATGKVVITLD